ncbi:PREDICTED: rho GTPase-activating protein 18-like, partial [Pterocles gutturalis]|uniref:rho GTPase-activating protein 18-like n=1 Tax=Pterocles gutturalis TaxID=240206 RepID=UPI0005290F11
MAELRIVNFRLPKDKTGTTKIGDLAPQDMKKVYSLALIELTALYDILGTEFKQQKAVKIKTKDSGLFGVPLSVLLEQDQKKLPGTKIPLIFQKLIAHIEEATLETEGLLRIPGVATRIKSLCQELEAKFYEGTFNWENVKQHDAASLLKLFIRELPQPLLTVEYLKAFQDVQNLPTKKQQLQALNLLVLLLPEANRDTLKDQSSIGHLVVGVCYRPPDQGEPVDEAFLLQLQEVFCVQDLDLMGDFSHLDICWDSGTAGGRQSRRFLESVEDNFLVQ